MQRRLLLGFALLLILCSTRSAVAKEPNEFDGIWIEVPQVRARVGKTVPREPVLLMVSGSTFIEKEGGRTVRESLVRYIRASNPKAIEFTTVVDGEFWLTRAIFKLENDTLTICESCRDDERPTEFRGFDLVADKVTSLRTFKRRPSGGTPKE